MTTATTSGDSLTPSLEDYLEAILSLSGESGVARVRDIAERLNVGKSAVTAALKSLAGRKLVNYDPYQFITLTHRGRKVARNVERRHTVIRRFLSEVVGLDEPAAEANACRIEHVIDRPLWERLRRILAFVEDRPAATGKWLKAFEAYCSSGPGEGG